MTADLQPPVNAHPEQKGHSGGRAWAMRGLAILGTVVLILGALAVWVDRVALDSSQWSDTSVKVLQDPTVQSTVATYMVDQLYDNVDVADAIGSFLPAAAKPLRLDPGRGPATARDERGPARARIERLQNRWRKANEKANRQLLRVINDDEGRGGGGARPPSARPADRGRCDAVRRVRSAARAAGQCRPDHAAPHGPALVRKGRGARAACDRELPRDPRRADLRRRGLGCPRPQEGGARVRDRSARGRTPADLPAAGCSVTS